MLWYEIVFRVVLAVIVGCVIGGEREHQHRPAGLRTHILVCVGAALVAVMESLNAAQVEAMGGSATNVNLGRMSAQVISGIGFLGAGTIFMASKKIAGLTTAASLWCTACLGLAAGMGHYALLIAGCVTVVGTLALLPHIVHHDHILRMEITCERDALSDITHMLKSRGIRVLDVDFAEREDRTAAQMALHLPRHLDIAQLVLEMNEDRRIHAVRTMNE